MCRNEPGHARPSQLAVRIRGGASVQELTRALAPLLVSVRCGVGVQDLTRAPTAAVVYLP